MPRLLRMLDRVELRTTFFVPGWVAETWPDVARSVRDAGHEIGHHGYLHESVRGVGRGDRGGLPAARPRGARHACSASGPIGYRAPSWDMNFRTPALLAKHGFRYDSGAHGFGPSVPAAARPRRSIELPVHWSLDDWNRWNYVPGYASSPILRPSDVEAAWAEELEAIVEVGGLFNLTMHPFISGRPARAAAIERLIERARAIDGLWIAAGDEIAAWVATLDLPRSRTSAPSLR